MSHLHNISLDDKAEENFKKFFAKGTPGEQSFSKLVQDAVNNYNPKNMSEEEIDKEFRDSEEKVKKLHKRMDELSNMKIKKIEDNIKDIPKEERTYLELKINLLEENPKIINEIYEEWITLFRLGNPKSIEEFKEILDKIKEVKNGRND